MIYSIDSIFELLIIIFAPFILGVLAKDQIQPLIDKLKNLIHSKAQ